MIRKIISLTLVFLLIMVNFPRMAWGDDSNDGYEPGAIRERNIFLGTIFTGCLAIDIYKKNLGWTGGYIGLWGGLLSSVYITDRVFDLGKTDLVILLYTPFYFIGIAGGIYYGNKLGKRIDWSKKGETGLLNLRNNIFYAGFPDIILKKNGYEVKAFIYKF